MRLKSINSHLRPYSIEKKRRTTIAHAFASALAQADSFDEVFIISALSDLGQNDFNNLTCVYCSKQAKTWDHLTSLVKNGELHGYGHQIGNLVPCCQQCNSAKGSLPFDLFIERCDFMSDEAKRNLKAKLTKHQLLSTKIDSSTKNETEIELLKKYRQIQDEVVALLKDGDRCAEAIRALRR